MMLICQNCQDSADTPEETTTTTTQELKVVFNVNKTCYEGDATRAENLEWKDGTVIYLTFETDKGEVFGNARYTKSSDSWVVNYNGDLNIGKQSKLTALFIDNGDTTVPNIVVSTPLTPVYEELDGSYQISDDTLIVFAKLEPASSRLRFKGDREITLTQGYKYVQNYNPVTGEKTFSSTYIKLSITDSYTSYIYLLPSNEENTLTCFTSETDQAYGFSKSFPQLAEKGKSGYINMPIKDSYPGWTLYSPGFINGHEFVDMGLSVKWATCNIGATLPGDYGNYYAWGETSTKSDYSSSTSKTYGKTVSDFAGNATYDAATANWKSPWRMPKKSDFENLINNSTSVWTTYNGQNGRLFTSKINGSKIFLPAAGIRDGTSAAVSTGSLGFYWSSTPYESNTDYAWSLRFYSGSAFTDYYYRYFGQSVRPVTE